MRNVGGGGGRFVFPVSAFPFGPGPATATCSPWVISAAALKIRRWILSWWVISVGSSSKGIAASFPPGRVSHASNTLRSRESKIAVGWASCIFGICPLVYLSRGFVAALLEVAVRFAWSRLLVTIARRAARESLCSGVLSLVAASLAVSTVFWGRGIGGVSTDIVRVPDELGSFQSGPVGGSLVVCGDGEGGGEGLSSFGNGGNGRVGGVVRRDLGWV